jgi:hypothetical protein
MEKSNLINSLSNKQKEYDYSLIENKFNYKDKLPIICHHKDGLGREHGVFYSTFSHLKRGDGCPKCIGKYMDKELFVYESKLIHGDVYSYNKSIFLGKKKKLTIYCNKHHLYFQQTPEKHLAGHGCPKCRYEKASASKMKTLDEFIERSKTIHGNKYDYSHSIYKGSDKPITLICHEKDNNGIEHGKFDITPNNHLHKSNPQGCPKCGRISSALKRVKPFETFVKEANVVHDNKYSYVKETYTNASSIVDIICPIHGLFPQKGTDHICLKQGCPKCSNQMSMAEEEIVNFLKSILPNTTIERRNRILIAPQELDILIPQKKVAIEFNGLIWHSDKFNTDKKYHLNKTNECKNQGINLIHIFEDEWLFHKDTVKAKLKRILSIPTTIVSSNDCVIKTVNPKEAKVFISENSLEPYHPSTCRYGLYYNDELLMLLGIKKETITNYVIKNDYSVTGGLQRLINHISTTHNLSVLNAYVDKRWHNTSELTNIGFEYVKDIKPIFYYISGRRRTNIKPQNGEINKIYDCGKELYVLKMSHS